MKLRRPRVRPPPETIIALVDIVFFLLVFFLLVGRMEATAPFEFDPPVTRSGQDMPAGGLNLMVARDGALALDGAALERAELAAVLDARPESARGRQVRISADSGARLGDVLPLVAELRLNGYLNVVLAVTPLAP